MKLKTTQIFVLLFGLIFMCQSLPTPGTHGSAEASNKVEQAKEFVAKGMSVPMALVKEVSETMTALGDYVKYIHDEMKRMEEVTITFDNRALDLTEDYYNKFYPIRQNLRKTRLGLKKLAEETIVISRKVKAFFNHSERLGDKRALELQLKTLERFLIKSVPVLREAESEYKSAIDKLENFEPMMHTFRVEMNREINKIQRQIQNLMKNKRENENMEESVNRQIAGKRQEINEESGPNVGAIIGASIGTVVFGVLDGLGCMGKCLRFLID